MASADILEYLSSIISTGMLVGTLIMSIWGGFKRRIYDSYVGESLVGISAILVDLSTSIPLITAAQFLSVLAMPITNGSSQAIWQSKVAQDVQGRVFSVRRMVAFSIMPLAYLVTGPLSERVFTPLLMEAGSMAGSLGGIFSTITRLHLILNPRLKKPHITENIYKALTMLSSPHVIILHR